MRLSNIANVIDTEFDGGVLLEVGLTEVNLDNRVIKKTVSYPISHERDIPVSKEIEELTGWTRRELNRKGEPINTVADRLINKYGCRNRLIVIDQWTENAIQILPERVVHRVLEHLDLL